MATRTTPIALPLFFLVTIAALAWDGPAKSPDQDLPPHITRLTFFGERADFSHDGKRVLFVEKTFGDVYEIELSTKVIRLLTGHYKPKFSAYGYQGTDVCGVDLETKKVTNYSDAANQYDEPEGVFPDGRSTLVECDRESQNGRGPGHVDIWKLSLDGRRAWERLTSFNTYPGYKASNPVVSDDGKFMAFQMARSIDPAGVGYGIFLYDFARAAQPR